MYGHRSAHVQRQLGEYSRAPQHNLQANYTTCGLAATQNGTSAGVFIPNPQTGTIRQLRRLPSADQLNLSMQIGYQITPASRSTLLLGESRQRMLRRLVGTMDQAVPAKRLHVRIIPNYYYVSNFYNGSSPNDRRQRRRR